MMNMKGNIFILLIGALALCSTAAGGTVAETNKYQTEICVHAPPELYMPEEYVFQAVEIMPVAIVVAQVDQTPVFVDAIAYEVQPVVELHGRDIDSCTTVEAILCGNFNDHQRLCANNNRIRGHDLFLKIRLHGRHVDGLGCWEV